jgi:hypothetical protein
MIYLVFNAKNIGHDFKRLSLTQKLVVLGTSLEYGTAAAVLSVIAFKLPDWLNGDDE